METIKDIFGYLATKLISISVVIWVIVGLVNGSYEQYGLFVTVIVPFLTLLMMILTIKDIAQLMDDGSIEKKVCTFTHGIYAFLVVLGVFATLYMKFDLILGVVAVALSVIGKLFITIYKKRTSESKA
ncbi:hypothetical protein DSB67_20920 [Vibrio campbellii]|uniref:hypothetical protein n=1 Tax=Vibrio campbellii TaxID=680 RepID=UPI00026C53E8|nr:hypothetical protein [Vibrio campbellii]AXB33861.1 hypothetical protein DSB67_20920 [Vibrio campbellii]